MQYSSISVLIKTFNLFRYNGENIDEDLIDRETKHLQRLKQKIEERKKTHGKQKVLNVITLKQDEEKVLDSKNQVHVEKIVSVDLEDGNKSLPDENKTEKRKKGANDKGSEFKVLGLNDFEKKSQVTPSRYYINKISSSEV